MFKILDVACTPKRGTKYSAYVDLFAREDVTIAAGKTKIVKLGIKLDMDFFESMFNPDKLDFKTAKVGGLYSDDELRIQKHQLHNFLKSHYLEIALRSSLGVKGLIIANGIGIIDLDYPDEIGLIVHNPYKYVGKRWLNHDGQYCPNCGDYQIDDDDGENLEGEIGEVTCARCNTDFVFVKNFRPTPPDFPYDCKKEWINTSYEESRSFKISKGDKVAQCTLKEHKGYLMGYETETLRIGGFGSTDIKEEALNFDKPDFFKCNVVD